MQKTWRSTVAGVLAIVAGALILLFGLMLSLLMPVAAAYRFALMTVVLIGALFLGTGIVALIGGITALQRRHWGLALAGSICALMPPATILGIVSIVFVALAREEFTSVTAETAGAAESTTGQDTPATTTSRPDAELTSYDRAHTEADEEERNA